MPKKIGITVTTRDAISHVLGLARAALAEGKQTEVFLTAEGIHLTQDRRFSELSEIARVGVCEVSYIDSGYTEKGVPGLKDKDFVTQARNAELVEDCDRYLVL